MDGQLRGELVFQWLPWPASLGGCETLCDYMHTSKSSEDINRHAVASTEVRGYICGLGSMTPSRVSKTGSHVMCPETIDGYRNYKAWGRDKIIFGIY